MAVDRKRDEEALVGRTLVEQLMATDWDATPIRNFIDAKPDPYRVAGTLVKMGLMSPSEAADYDWQEIDYHAFPTVRRLLEHYASIIPSSPLEVLLAKAGRRVKQGLTHYATEDYEVMAPGEGAEELFQDLIPILENPEEYGIDDPTFALAEVATDPKTLREFNASPRDAIIEAIITAEHLWGACSDEYERFLKHLKERMEQNRKLFKGLYLKKLEAEAYRLLGTTKEKAIKECRKFQEELAPETKKELGVSLMSEACNQVISMAEFIREDPNFRRIVHLAELDLRQKHPNWELDRIPQGYVLKDGTVFIYMLAHDFNRWKEEACLEPTKTKRLLETLQRIMDVINFGLDLIGGRLKVFTPDDVYKAITKALFEYFVTSALGTEVEEAPGIAIDKSGIHVKRPEPKMTGEEVLKAIEEFLNELEFFLPGVARKVREQFKELLSAQANKFVRMPSDPNVEVPTLFNPKLRVTADMLFVAYKKGQLPQETARLLTTEGIPLGQGEIRVYNARLLHRVTRYDGLDLVDLGYFVYYDPLTGSYYFEQRDRLIRMPLPKIIATINKDLGSSARVPAGGSRTVYYRGMPVGTLGGTEGQGWAPKAPVLPPEIKKELDELNQFFSTPEKEVTNPVLKKVLSLVYTLHGPDARRNLVRLIDTNGENLVAEAIQNVLSRGYHVEDPDFLSRVREALQFYHQFGRFPASRGTSFW